MSLIECNVSAPGKVILHGEHSVVYGKTAIAAALGVRTTVKIQEKKKPDQLLTIHLKNLELMISFSSLSVQESLFNIPIKKKKSARKWLDPNSINHDEYLKKINKFIEVHKEEYGLNLSDNQYQALTIILYLFCGILNTIEDEMSLDITVDSNLTIGAGTGSSASFAVSLAGAVLQYLRLKKDDLYFNTMKDEKPAGKTDVLSFNDEEKILISDWAFCCEKVAHGNPSGVDNATCTFGSLVQFTKGTMPIPHTLKTKLRILLVDTKVSRQTKDLVEKVVNLRTRYPQLVDSTMEALNQTALAALKVFNEMNGAVKIDNEDRNDQYSKLSELFDINHKLLSALDVSHPSLEKIKAISAQFNFSCKLTGAGGGGFAIVLIPPEADNVQVDKLMTVLKSNKFVPKLTEVGGDGVTID